MAGIDLDAWFVSEVLPLEAALTAYLRRHSQNPSEVPDLRQEVYARAFEAAQVSRPLQTKSFVFRIAHNLLIDRLRRAAIISFDDIADIEDSLVLTEEISPERQVIARTELKRLRAALEKLPPRCREVVALRKIEGLSQRDVAARLGIAEGTVEKQVAKGMRYLADALFGSGGEAVAAPLPRASQGRGGS